MRYTPFLALKMPWAFEDKKLLTLCDTLHDGIRPRDSKSVSGIDFDPKWAVLSPEPRPLVPTAKMDEVSASSLEALPWIFFYTSQKKYGMESMPVSCQDTA